MTSFALWRQFSPARWLILGLSAYLALYVLYWVCAVYRLNHPEIRPKLRLAAEMLAIEPNEREIGEAKAAAGTDERRFSAALGDAVRRRVADRFNYVSTLYSEFAFRAQPEPPSGVDSAAFNPTSAKDAEQAFLDAATDLAMAKEGTRAFAEALVRVDAIGKRWNRSAPPKLSFYQYWFRNHHSRQGASFGIPLPLGDAGPLRQGANDYLLHRNDFNFLRPDDVRREVTIAARLTTQPVSDDVTVRAAPPIRPTKYLELPYYDPPDFRHLARFVEPSLMHRPWHLLRWSDPGFYHAATRNPFVILTLVFTTFFFLNLRYSGWLMRPGEPAAKSVFTSVPKSPPRGGRLHRAIKRRIRSEQFWPLIGLITATVTAVVGEAHETWPEWLTTITVLPLAGLLVPTLICSLAAMSRTALSVEFLRMTYAKRLAHLMGFNLAAVATFVMATWLGYYSLFGQVVSYEIGRALRGLIQVTVALLVVYWLAILVVHLLCTPGQLPPADSDGDAPTPDFAQTVFSRLVEGAMVAILPVAASFLPKILEHLK